MSEILIDQLVSYVVSCSLSYYYIWAAKLVKFDLGINYRTFTAIPFANSTFHSKLATLYSILLATSDFDKHSNFDDFEGFEGFMSFKINYFEEIINHFEVKSEAKFKDFNFVDTRVVEATTDS